MTDKEKLKLLIDAIDYSFWNPVDGAYNKELTYPVIDKVKYIKRLIMEEPVSEFLNTESMIESYKQRLISQANGVKNSPLIDMCLASYKHGINETLDTLNLSNIERTVKNRKEPVSEELENAAIEWFNSIKYRSDISGSPINAFMTGAKWQKEQDQETIEVAEDHAMLAGMEKMKEEMMEKAIDAELYSDGMLTPLIGVNDKEVVKDIKFGDKIKLIIIKDKKDI